MPLVFNEILLLSNSEFSSFTQVVRQWLSFLLDCLTSQSSSLVRQLHFFYFNSSSSLTLCKSLTAPLRIWTIVLARNFTCSHQTYHPSSKHYRCWGLRLTMVFENKLQFLTSIDTFIGFLAEFEGIRYLWFVQRDRRLCRLYGQKPQNAQGAHHKEVSRWPRFWCDRPGFGALEHIGYREWMLRLLWGSLFSGLWGRQVISFRQRLTINFC